MSLHTKDDRGSVRGTARLADLECLIFGFQALQFGRQFARLPALSHGVAASCFEGLQGLVVLLPQL